MWYKTALSNYRTYTYVVFKIKYQELEIHAIKWYVEKLSKMLLAITLKYVETQWTFVYIRRNFTFINSIQRPSAFMYIQIIYVPVSKFV